MNDEQKKKVITEIRILAGQLGQDHESDGEADSDNYEFQIHIGLAKAVAELTGGAPSLAAIWFNYCLIECGVVMNKRVKELSDALQREVRLQVEFRDRQPGENE